MALKKSQLYSSIWQACDELRGGMDASQYKDYVLSLLFVRYVSDRYGKQDNSEVVIPKGASFDDLVALKGKSNIGEELDKAFSSLANANDLRGVIDTVSFNDPTKLGDGKEMVDRISNLIGIFENPDLDFSGNTSEGDDLLGDAYEYLMKHFAVQSGKSKGQFYTPAEVSRVIAKVVEANKAESRRNTVYDPTCGSGSLLLKVAAETPNGITIYGQEKETSTTSLAVMNMWLHGQTYSDIRGGQSTLSSPAFTESEVQLKTFDYVVANPPFSYKSWSNGFIPEKDRFERFDGFGIPPSKNGDYAFLLHIVKSLKSTGQGAVVLPHGVLFRGNAEADIRTNLIKRGYIKAIIGLPANLFYGTGIPACIIVIDKKDASTRDSVFMIDASKGCIKDGNKNRLREQDIHKIVDAYRKFEEIDKFSRLVPVSEIQKKEYNLNLPRYIDSQEDEDIQNIEAHLLGGIPSDDVDSLGFYWEVCPNLKDALFQKNGREGFVEIKVEQGAIRDTILKHSDFKSFSDRVKQIMSDWKTKHKSGLENINSDTRPKELIANLADDLLKRFKEVRLIDAYDVYQHLMSYWNETMQDDLYVLVSEGWSAGNQVIRLIKETKKKSGKVTRKEISGLQGLEGKLIPTDVLIDEYFQDEKHHLAELNDKLSELGSDMESMIEEHGNEDSLLAEVVDNGKIKKTDLRSRIKEIEDDDNYADELEQLEKYLDLSDQETETKKQIKSAEEELEKKIIKKYPTLTEQEIKKLVVKNKWYKTIQQRVYTELNRVSQRLTSRIKELSERYEAPLPELENEVQELTSKVEDHLKKMGFTW